ncbi:hypothetical protein MKW98_028415 [Papaver atlanticum]|uniref:Protein kinase domain-containing protein n=1 Tax=Papaver atlanticum TaxID=357466 RepID=A0AAD4SY93_9MAGN|nr:hypothetical protein MKW98_028415 [Papaver atlanticum]
MAVASPGQLNLYASPALGCRTVDCFDKLEQIGEGTYVYRAKDILTREIVSLKQIQMEKEKEKEGKLHHENVIKLKEIVTSTGPENDEQGKPSCYMKQLLTGLHYCHLKYFTVTLKVNFRPSYVVLLNVLIANLLTDNEGNLKLADFGLARSLSNDRQGNLTNEMITLWYRAPEILLRATKYGPSIDMWYVGCIFAELLQGKPILPGKDRVMFYSFFSKCFMVMYLTT